VTERLSEVDELIADQDDEWYESTIVRELRRELAEATRGEKVAWSCATSETEQVMKLRQQLADVTEKWRVMDNFHTERSVQCGRLINERDEARQQLADSQAQVAVLGAKLGEVAAEYRVSAEAEGCEGGFTEGRSYDSCVHCQLLQDAEDIDKLLANLPDRAKALLSERERMRTALAALHAATGPVLDWWDEIYPESVFIGREGCDEGVERVVSIRNELRAALERAREARREEVVQGDKTEL
jgi:hypothetical protein